MSLFTKVGDIFYGLTKRVKRMPVIVILTMLAVFIGFGVARGLKESARKQQACDQAGGVALFDSRSQFIACVERTIPIK